MAITTGKGLQFGDSSSIMIYGYPLPNYLSSIVHGKPAPWSVINPTSNFNISGLPINNEVVVAFANVTIYEGSTITVDWYRTRDNFKCFSVTAYANATWVGYASWIGYCTKRSTYLNVDEITENGEYRVDFKITGTTNYNQSAYFYVTGIPVQTNVISPSPGQDFTSTVTINAEAFGGDGISHVNFFHPQLGTQTIYPPSNKSSYPFSATFNTTSLSNGEHTFTVRAYDLSGAFSSSKTITLNKAFMDTPSNINFNATGQTTAQVTWDGVPNTFVYEIELYGPTGMNSYISFETNRSFTNLQPGEWYLLRIKAYSSGGTTESAWSTLVDTITFPPDLTGLMTTNITANSISVSWAPSNGADFYEVILNDSVYGGVSGATSYTLNLLQPSTQYTIRVIPRNQSGNGGYQQLNATTLSGRPDNWEWFTYEIVYFANNYPTNNILHTRWNELVDRVNQFADYKNKTRLSTSGSTNVKMSSSDKIVYAWKFRAVANKIHEMSNAVSSEVRNVQGVSETSNASEVKGWYFTHLESAIKLIQ